MIRFGFWVALFFIPVVGFCQNDVILFGDSTLNRIDQSFIVTGTITSLVTGKPLSGAHIHLDGILGGVADENGRYFITLKSGANRIIVRYVSMVPKKIDVLLYANGLLNIGLEEKVFELEEIVVRSQEDDANVKESIAGISTLSVAAIKSLPALVGEPDVVKILQLLPGVTSVGEGSAGVNVRGGRTDQNLMLVNDAILLNTNHAIGFLSPYNSDVVENFTLYKGTIPSVYGGRSSSILDVQLRNGDFTGWKAQISPGFSVSKVLVEGPLLKNKVSLLIAGRISNTNWLLRRVDNVNVNSSTITFNDSYSSISFRFNSKNSLVLNLLTTSDYFQFSNQYGYEWSTLLTSANLKNIISKRSSFVTLFAFGRLRNSNFNAPGNQAAVLTNGMDYQQVKTTYLFTTEKSSLSTGAETVIYRAAPETIRPNSAISSVVSKDTPKSNGQELALFVSHDWSPNSWFSTSIGLRYSLFYQQGPATTFVYQQDKPRTASTIIDTLSQSGNAIQHYNGLEPRFSARLSLSSTQSIKFGYSRVYQYLHSISNTTAPTPIDIFQVSTKYILPQQSDNYSIGYFQNFKKNKWSMSVDLFYRQSENQLEYKDFAMLYLNDHIETELLNAKGKAYGLEFQLKKNIGKWSGWLAYTFSRSFAKADGKFADEKINKGEWFAANHDKPHVASLVLNRKFWPSGSFNMTATYSTGRPISIIDAYYSTNGTVIPNYSNRNEFRIPDYFRVDIAFTIENIINKIDDSLVIGVYNLFGFNNAYSVYYQRFADRPELVAYKLSLIGSPLPSLTYTMKFK